MFDFLFKAAEVDSMDELVYEIIKGVFYNKVKANKSKTECISRAIVHNKSKKDKIF